MHTLFFDLASNQGLIACVTESSVVASSAVDHRVRDDALLPLVTDTLKKAGWTEADLTSVACVTGPGGFTSLRVGVAMANTLAWALDIPAIGLPLWHLYAARCEERQSVVWLHSTKKTDIFLRALDAAEKEPSFLPLEDGAKTASSFSHYCGELLPDHQARIEQAGPKPASLKPLEAVLPGVLSAASATELPLEPWYGRGW